MGRLGTGILLQNILSEMSGISTTPLSQKFIYYSAHDGTLLSLFSAMNIQPRTLLLYS